MRINVCGVSFTLTHALFQHARLGLEAALHVAQGRARRADMRLSDVNGNHGGVDKLCRIVAWIGGNQVVVVESVDRDMYVAVDQASDMLRESIKRRLNRRRTLRRQCTRRAPRYFRSPPRAKRNVFPAKEAA